MVGVLEAYRAAVLHAESGRPADAVSLLQDILRDEPDLTDVWRELGDTAARAQRQDLALDAYRQLLAREPEHAAGLIGAALTLVRLRRFADAQQEAQRAAFAATETDADARALPAYVAGRWLADQRRHEEALAAFSSALDTLARPAGRRLDDLHFYTAEVLARLDRPAEAEYHYLEELSAAPSHIRARAGLATLYHRTGRTGEAEEAIAELARTAPTPEGFAAAARLWTLLGNTRAAAEARAHARRPAQSQPARSEQ
jgi:tetratricopeptide (TPR) repeat protein